MTGNLAGALTGLFGPVALPLVGLIISRDNLRARLRAARPSRFPLMAEAGRDPARPR